jgi:hypothetical protein
MTIGQAIATGDIVSGLEPEVDRVAAHRAPACYETNQGGSDYLRYSIVPMRFRAR